MATTQATRAPAGAAGTRRADHQPLAGTGTLIRFMLRRDRIRLPVWIIAISGFTVISASGFPEIYADAASRQARAELITNPGTAAISGPGIGLEDYTFGAMLTNEMLSWVAIFAALMSILLMVRHTRAEEETGRAELVRAGVVGRHANLTAALVVVGGGSLAMGGLLGAGLGALGLDDVGWAGSWLFGLATAAIGVVFAAVTAVAVQLSGYARGAGGLAGAALGAVYLLRAAGDMSAVSGGGGELSWLSPIGWSQQTLAYVDDRWWPLLLSAGLATVLAALAYWLSARRDVGSGMLQARPGSPVGSPRLASALGLAWRQQRASFLWWAVALTLFGLGYGTLVGEVESFSSENAAVQEWIESVGTGTMIDGFLAIIALLWATAVTVYATLAVLKLRSEESAGRVEALLATATSRTRWLASHLTVAALGAAVLLLLSGAGLAATAAATLEDGEVFLRVVGATIAYLPAVWLVVGLAVALFGWLPRATLLVWLVIAYSGLMVSFAGLLGLPDWTMNLSPLGHVPSLPAVAMEWTPLVILTTVAVGLIAAGLIGFRRRDLEMK